MFIVETYFIKLPKKFLKFYSIILQKFYSILFTKFQNFLLVQNFKNLYKHIILVSIYVECNTKSSM